MEHKRAISFPHMGNYHIPIQSLLCALFPDDRVFAAPPMTQKTVELGSRHSPDFVCAPFKYNLGNFIEALEAGANILFQTGMGCRYGYYGELQEQILRDLGYDFRFVCLSRERARPHAAYRTMKELGSPLSAPQMLRAFLTAVEQVRVMDRFEFAMRQNAGFEKMPGAHAQLHGELLKEVEGTDSLFQLHRLHGRYTEDLQSIPVVKPNQPLRVGLVGELYTLMEPFSNFFLEKELAKRGIGVSRRMSVSFLMFGKHDGLTLQKTGPYLHHPVGANGIDSVAQARWYAKRGYDGIIHMKSFGCTPELNAMPALQNLAADYGLPILHLSFDSHTSGTGVQTRLEAFCDMIEMRRGKGKNGGDSQPGSGHRLHIHQGSPAGR